MRSKLVEGRSLDSMVQAKFILIAKKRMLLPQTHSVVGVGKVRNHQSDSRPFQRS